jgi:L-alanine-DL-glutamate epimerase-like enolase superfamily enzyme
MLITNVKAHHIRIPYDAGVASLRQGAAAIAALDMVLVEVSTDAGLTGWGDAFAYVCPRSAATAVEEMIAPQAQGREAPDADAIPGFMEEVQRNLHLFGRYGITMFAISALDIALWDLAAKARNEPLHRIIGERKRARIPAYASLLRIGKPELIAGECETARRRGYPAIKLHETTVPAVTAARGAIGAGVPQMVDMNCPMDERGAIAFAHVCRAAAPLFLEEPVWPPEDFAALARVRAGGGLAIAGRGECLHTLSISPDDGRGGRDLRAALRHQGRGDYRVSQGSCAGRRNGRKACAPLPLLWPRLSGHAATYVAAR